MTQQEGISVFALLLSRFQRSRASGTAMLLCNYPESPGANPCGWHEYLPLLSVPPSLSSPHPVSQRSTMCLQHGRSWSHGLCLLLHSGANGPLVLLAVGIVLTLFAVISLPPLFDIILLFCVCRKKLRHIISTGSFLCSSEYHVNSP